MVEGLLLSLSAYCIPYTVLFQYTLIYIINISLTVCKDGASLEDADSRELLVFYIYISLFEFCVFVAGWRHALRLSLLRSEWPLLLLLYILIILNIIICTMLKSKVMYPVLLPAAAATAAATCHPSTATAATAAATASPHRYCC